MKERLRVIRSGGEFLTLNPKGLKVLSMDWIFVGLVYVGGY